MHSSLNRNLYFVREHTGIFKAANNYDVLDPETSEPVFECREERLGMFTKILRFTDYKRMTPFDIEVRTPSGEPVIRIGRGISIFLSKVDVYDENGRRIGGFKQKLFSIGGKFDVLDENDEPICALAGNWRSWDFRFVGDDGVEYGHVAKKWAGLGKELFTSADNYMLEINDSVPPDHPLRQLILAAVLCIDMVLKE